MARDPALFRGGQANLFAYVGNDPVHRIDPSGLWTFGVGQSFGFGYGVDFSGGWQVAFDSSGGLDVQYSLGIGSGGGAGFNALNFQWTNAETVDELHGWGLEFAASVAALSGAAIFGSTYQGFELGVGLGLEGHVNVTHTWDVNSDGLACDPSGPIPQGSDWWDSVRTNWWD